MFFKQIYTMRCEQRRVPTASRYHQKGGLEQPRGSYAKIASPAARFRSTSSITGLSCRYLYLVTIPLVGFWDGSRAQKISPSRILRCSVFRLRRMRLSRPSHTIVCSYAW
jgi:hypothetical protein